MHLVDNATNNIFLNFLEHSSELTNNLFILGDLFDYWVGDDSGMYSREIAALRKIGEQKNIYFIHGNRDFLIGKNFFRENHITILDDETRITLGNHHVLLMHGDTLCSDDTDYQDFRKEVRSIKWQENFLAKKLDERISIATDLREQSKKLNLNKPENIIDVNEKTVKSVVEKNLPIQILIHGHTHRQNTHLYKAFTRFVLGDWKKNQGNYLIWKEAEGFEFKAFS
ncbi:UDP-2,3-diacylglucosamine hydrolase [beta proteobacterium KB13]|uniref:UDP-2,3-diacylglucosamine hydrolase n=1 Tax=beta proteobacterium KB13 TaxID=314607 RepID=B6BUY8_9PROT|nr:UDP-2,3-diacylglucosamine hydrolase [beta proteobacterium KB13]